MGSTPRCSNASGVTMRPRGVRLMKPSLIRKGSYTSSIAAVELADYCCENLVVDFVESVAVDVQCLKRVAGYCYGDFPVSFHLGEVAHAAQKSVRNAWCAAAAESDFHGCVGLDRGPEQCRRTAYDAFEHGVVVVLQMALYAETCPQRRCEQAAACCGADESEGVEGELYTACAGAFVDHYVDAVVLHR